ncbi:MAG: glycosyltransferase family 2 protein [Tenuifilaceae bacterium]|jgi:hypothetical protein|nr:glycosyltransferase family 2 protein [Bacteroidales bacterium]MDI9517013.1 glycosyltransferase family 2 protein [Bacteroidota bacterium]OQC61174.1 MAG: N-acetylglucosaminyl-diphospho-decaprenol L-rhamnosyltransferase [Bacteroidetes bacterium ADurb.Bin008]HNV81480.1 glycosyltransferase family 2 protein [Tenuifilaceae bacterium]MZP81591.1 glycosyltransferase [Bacteroidales bacterium]
MKSIAIVILNWNGKHYLEQFLHRVVQHSILSTHRVEVVVADNGSNDGSVAWLKNQMPAIRIIEFDKNHGFAGGYNLALKQIDADYYLLLNSDIKVEEGWLQPLVNFMDANPMAAACSPKILSFHEPEKFEYAGAAGGFIDLYGYPFCRGRILSTIEKDEGQYDEAAEVFWASGACLLINAKTYWEAGGFDPDFFAHMEEIDLCWRLKRLGYSVWCIPQSKVFHVGGGTLPNNSPRKVYLNHRNNLVMLLKNLDRKKLFSTMAVRYSLDIASVFGYALGGKPQFSWAVVRAHLYVIRRTIGIIKKRRAIKEPKIAIYPYSIVWQYFIKRRRVYSQLPTT